MKVLVAGMQKSGSTALFNIIRLCFIESGSVPHSSWYHFYEPKNISVHHVVKVHALEEDFREWADIIFTAKRDIRDSMSSAKRCLKEFMPKGDYDFDEVLKLNTGYYFDWKPYSDYEFVYEDYTTNHTKVIAEIAEKLGVSINPKEVYSKLIDLTYNCKSFGIHTPHLITSHFHVGKMQVGGYRDFLTEDEIEGIYKYGKI